MDEKFTDLVLAIDAKNYNVLAKMDAVLRLNKKGYSRDNVMAGLAYVARRIVHNEARDIALDAYYKRVR